MLLKRVLNVFLSVLLLVPHTVLANTSPETYMFNNNSGGMLKSYYDRFVHLNEEEIKNTYHKDHPIWRLNNAEPLTEIRNAGFIEDSAQNEKKGRYFRVVKNNKGETVRRILFKQQDFRTGEFRVQFFDVPFGEYENSAFKPTKFRQTLRDPRFAREVTIRLGMDTLGFYVAGNLVQRFANSAAGLGLEGPEAYAKRIEESVIVPSGVKELVSDVLNLEKFILGESLTDPMFYENELLRLKDPQGWVHFGAFIAVNRMMNEFAKFYTPAMGGTGNPNTLNKFQKSAVWAGRNPFASMAVASIGASVITEVGFGVYNCTLPRIIELSYGLVNLTQEEVDQKLHECDRVMEETVTGKVFERWMYDTFFSMLPAVFLSHVTQGLITGKTYGQAADLYRKSRALTIKASEKIGITNADAKKLNRVQQTINNAANNIKTNVKNKAQYLHGVRNASISKKLSDSILANAMKSSTEFAGYSLQKAKAGGSFFVNAFRGLKGRYIKAGQSHPMAGLVLMQIPNFTMFLAAMARTRYYAVPFEVWKHSRHIDAATKELTQNIQNILSDYGPISRQGLALRRAGVSLSEPQQQELKAEAMQDIKDNIYHFGRMHEDWRNYILADSNLAFSNWVTHTSKLQQKYDAAYFVYDDLVKKAAEFDANKEWTQISKPTRDAVQTYQTEADQSLFYFSEVAPRTQVDSQEVSRFDLESLYPREDMAKLTRGQQAYKRVALIQEQIHLFERGFRASTVEDEELKQEAEKVILGLGRDVEAVKAEFKARGLSEKAAYSAYFKHLNQSIKDLNQLVNEKAPDILSCMNSQSQEFNYCNFALLHFNLGSPGHLGERYIDNMARLLTDPSGPVVANNDYRDEKVGLIHTNNMAEYVVAQAVCGPSAEKTSLPKSFGFFISNYYDLDSYQVKRIEQCYTNKVNGSGFWKSLTSFVSSAKRDENYNEDLYACVRLEAPEIEQNEFMRNIRGISLDFDPPSLMENDMSYVCNQLREAQKTNVSKKINGEDKASNIYNWAFTYQHADGKTYQSNSLIEILLYNIKSRLINGHTSHFDAWWADSGISYSYQQRIAEAHIKYKALVNQVIKPALFGSKNSSELWDANSSNRWSAAKVSADAFSEDDWNRHHQFGAYDSIVLELKYYLDQVLLPIVAPQQGTQWKLQYEDLKAELYSAIDAYVFEEQKFLEEDQEKSSNMSNNIQQAFNNILQVTASLVEHMGLSEYKQRFQIDAGTPSQGHTKYTEKDAEMYQAMESYQQMMGQQVAKSDLNDLQKTAVDQTVKNMTSTLLMLANIKDLITRLDMAQELRNPESYYKVD